MHLADPPPKVSIVGITTGKMFAYFLSFEIYLSVNDSTPFFDIISTWFLSAEHSALISAELQTKAFNAYKVVT